MWWKVELDKAGRAIKCDPVLAPAKRGHSLRFVEAETREEAIELATNWLKRFRAQQLESRRRRDRRRLAANLCIMCGENPPEPGIQKCRACSDRKAQWRENWVEAGKPERPKADPVKARVAYEALHGLTLHAPTALRRFDELGPTLFRAWLVAFIEDKKAKARGERTEAAE